MPARSRVHQSGLSRVFLIENGAGPANVARYMGLWKAGAPSWAQGDVTTIKIPSETRYNQFDAIGKIQGERGDPQVTIMARYELSHLSDLLRLARNGCDHDLQIHLGECSEPKDFNAGWEKVLVLESARATNWSTGDIGALQESERALVNEEVPFTGQDLYEVGRMDFAEQALTQIVQEIVGVTVCDAVNCGICGISSDGCQIVFAVTLSAGGSPGLAAELIWTEDGGTTWNDDNISTLSPTENPNGLACIGTNLVVVSDDSESLHYAPIADILDGSAVWTEVTTGFVATKGPRAVFTLGPSLTWMVAEGGYVYFTDDPTAGVEVQDAGVATVNDLNDIHGYDEENLVAVGNTNTVLLTRNGGTTWASITGPAVGVNLNTVWMKSEDEWYVGTAGGKLYYTRDGGDSWTEKTFTGSGAGQVRDLYFATPSVGFMAHDTATPRGRILRTIDGGNSWYVLPEGSGTLPLNDRVNALAACDPNTVFGGGLADNATDGYLVKGAA